MSDWRLSTKNRSIALTGQWPELPFPRTDLPRSFSDGYAKRGIAVQDSDAEVELSDLVVSAVPRIITPAAALLRMNCRSSSGCSASRNLLGITSD